MNKRPMLEPILNAEQFLDNYWLKEELGTFCRGNEIGATFGTTIRHQSEASLIREVLRVTKDFVVQA